MAKSILTMPNSIKIIKGDNMNEVNQDLKLLQKYNTEMDVKSDMGYKYEDMYTDDYIEFLSQLCNKYDVEFNEDDIDWEWCNYIQNKQFELENKIKQSNEYEISNDEIVANMTANEKFTIICRAKNIDKDKMTESIIRAIQDSYIEDKDAYIGEQEVWDDEYIHITHIYHELYIDESLTWTKEQAIKEFESDIDDDWELDELWIELNKEGKDFIKLALRCGIRELKVEMM